MLAQTHGACLRLLDPTCMIVRSYAIQEVADIVFDVGKGAYDINESRAGIRAAKHALRDLEINVRTEMELWRYRMS